MKRQRGRWTPYLFIMPHFILFLVFFAIPVLTAVVISFCRWNFYTGPVFVGFKNYWELLLHRNGYFYNEFWGDFLNTLNFVLWSVPLLVVVPLLIAAGLRAKTVGSKLFQSIFYLPYLLSVSTVALTWRWMLDPTFGFVNQLLHTPQIAWTIDQPYFWIGVVVMSVWWGIGGNMVIFLAGMADISPELYEAADIDGANPFQKFRSVTLPGLANQILYTVVMTTIASFNIFGQPLMLAKDLPTQSQKTVLIMIQQTAFGADTPLAGMASAAAVMLGIGIMIVSVFQFRFMKTEN